MAAENQPQSDHDLLIILNANFGSFQNSHTTEMKALNDKVTQFIVSMDQKAAKSDIVRLESLVGSQDKRISDLEEIRKIHGVQKETTAKIGKMGLNTWTFILGTILSLIALYQFLTK